MREWVIAGGVGVVAAVFAATFAMALEGFNPNESGRTSNAIGFGVIIGVWATLVLRGVLWMILRR